MALRFGLVGSGRWGRIIERTLLTFPGVSVIQIGKGDRPVAGLDGVLIATQSARHAHAALPYVEAGVPTFIEKPMTTTVTDAERIREAAKRSGAIIFVGHIYLHHPAVLAAVELLPSLGKVRYLLWEGMNDKPRTDSSVLWDWLPHGLSIARLVFARDPDHVAAWSLFGEAKPEAAVATFRYGQAALVAEISWLSPLPRMRMTIAGENGTLIFDDKATRKLVLYQGPADEDITYPPYAAELPLTREMAAFVQAVSSGTPDPSQIEIGTSIVGAIDAAHASIAAEGQMLGIGNR